VHDAVDASKPSIETHRHLLTTHVATEPALVFGDPARLGQVVVNLLNNASKYTPDGGKVSTACKGNRVTLRVVDTGLGMSQALLQHAFEPYVQGEHGSDRAEGGLGLGLTLVKGIVEFHGGSVTAQSAGEGRGTTITVTLPLHKAQ
jgi:signal transduction histidine kinase